MAQGVFSLLEVRSEQVKNVADSNFASWPEGATYGYFVGGNNSGAVNTVDKIDFFGDIVSSTITYPTNLQESSTISTGVYGYFIGGNTGGVPNTSTINRLDFSNETFSLPGKNLPAAANFLTTVSNNYYGYIGGNQNTITRLDFITENVTNISSTFPVAKSNLASISSSSYGYFGGGGGGPGSTVSTITRLDFSNETISDPSKNLPSARNRLAATSSSSYGYFAGGNSGSVIDTISRISFFDETISNPGTNLPSTVEVLSATSNNSYGYFGGGNNPSPTGSNLSRVTKFDFINETVRNINNNLSEARDRLTALSGGASIPKVNKTAGYILGNSRDSIKYNFSTNTVSTAILPAPTAITDFYRGFGASNNYYGYFAGGCDDDNLSAKTNVISNFYRFDFSNETNQNLPATKGIGVAGAASIQTNNYGYFGGGFVNPNATSSSKISRLDFSTESTSSPVNFSAAIKSSFGTSSNTYGYFAGGDTGALPTPTLISTITRLDLSSETLSQSTNNLQTTRMLASAANNNLYGYFAGGEQPTIVSTITRLDFSTESISNPGRTLTIGASSARTRMASLSSNSTAYFCGGLDGNTNIQNGVNSMDFSTETVITNTAVQNIKSATGLSNSN